MIFKPDTVLFAAVNDDQSLEEAKLYMTAYGLTREYVKVVVRKDMLCVVATKEGKLGTK